VVGDAGADDATTDDDDLCPLGDLVGHRRRVPGVVGGGSDGFREGANPLLLDAFVIKLQTLTPVDYSLTIWNFETILSYSWNIVQVVVENLP